MEWKGATVYQNEEFLSPNQDHHITSICLLLLSPILNHLQASPFLLLTSPTSASLAFFCFTWSLWRSSYLQEQWQLDLKAPRLGHQFDLKALRLGHFPTLERSEVCWNFHGGEHLVYELLGRHLWGEWSWRPLWPFTNVQGRAYMHQGVSNKRWNQELVCPEALPVSATLMKGLAFVSVILYYTVQILCILYCN